MGQVLVIGSLNMDMTFFVDHFPQVGQTVAGQGFQMTPGGKGANQALAAARLGSRVCMAGCVGDDVYADMLLRGLEKDGVDTTHVKRAAGVNTGLACITVCGGANIITIDAGANAHILPADIDQMEDVFDQVDVVILQFEIPMETVVHAAEVARRHGCTVVVNPAPCRPVPQALMANTDYLIPNETEAMELLGMEALHAGNVGEALAAMRRKGVRTPVITLGEQGAAYLEDGACRLQPCVKVQAVDSTAAGDTFIGALVCALTEGKTMTEAVAFAQRAAAICVTRKGAQSSIPTRDEVLSAEDA